ARQNIAGTGRVAAAEKDAEQRRARPAEIDIQTAVDRELGHDSRAAEEGRIETEGHRHDAVERRDVRERPPAYVSGHAEEQPPQHDPCEVVRGHESAEGYEAPRGRCRGAKVRVCQRRHPAETVHHASPFAIRRRSNAPATPASAARTSASQKACSTSIPPTCAKPGSSARLAGA